MLSPRLLLPGRGARRRRACQAFQHFMRRHFIFIFFVDAPPGLRHLSHFHSRPRDFAMSRQPRFDGDFCYRVSSRREHRLIDRDLMPGERSPRRGDTQVRMYLPSVATLLDSRVCSPFGIRRVYCYQSPLMGVLSALIIFRRVYFIIIIAYFKDEETASGRCDDDGRRGISAYFEISRCHFHFSPRVHAAKCR